MYDPFQHYVGTPEGPASAIFAITPSDTQPLPRGVKMLRVYNSVDTVMYITIVPIKGNGDPTTPDMSGVSLPIPPMTVIWEEVRTAYVLATGTDAPGLIIHGYTD